MVKTIRHDSTTSRADAIDIAGETITIHVALIDHHSMGSSKPKKKKTKEARENPNPSVVGPDLFLLLQGSLFDSKKNVALVLCGESHNDAVDITRRSPPGKFEPTEGWIPLADSSDMEEGGIHTVLPGALCVSPSSTPSLRMKDIGLRFLHPIQGKKRNNPWVTLDKARKLATDFVETYAIEDDMVGKNLFLLWIVPSDGSSRRRNGAEEGQAFLIELETDVLIQEYLIAVLHDAESYEEEDEDTPEVFDDWVFFSSENLMEQYEMQRQNRLLLPDLVVQWMDETMMVDNTGLEESNPDDGTVSTVDSMEDDEEADDDEENGEISNPSLEPPSPMISRYVLLEYGDLDSEAHDLAKRRLGMTDAEVTEDEYDSLVEGRKRRLRDEHNVWTFDDWFDHVKEKTEQGRPGDPSVHLIFEASVPPSEVELYRASVVDDSSAQDLRLFPASECVRCLEEDSEASEEDEIDPSNDGIGSYIDFVYRKMMATTTTTTTEAESNLFEGADQSVPARTDIPISEDTDDAIENGANDDDDGSTNQSKAHVEGKSHWFHCIDVRDLGCEAACHAKSVQQEWYKLLTEEERPLLDNPKDVPSDTYPIDSSGKSMRFLPEPKLNPERIELNRLKSEGLLVVEEDDNEEEDAGDNSDNEHRNALEFTFPSFELFFGTNTDNIYYSPHIKLAYSPFLANCVGSLDIWRAFCTTLFFGGTIPDALALLNLDDSNSRGSVHIRSPILQQWDPETESYLWKERDECEDYISCPYFPHTVHLIARGSSPPRTWSSQLFHNLFSYDNDVQGPNSRRSIALAIQSWILNSIQKHMVDPKTSDDPDCGGEWFVAFLRAVHREIYDDIDVSNPSVLIQKKYMKSLHGNNRFAKHNIGKIKIPSATDAFEEILARFQEDNLPPTDALVTPRVEILGKLLIDIWISNLFDFSMLLKIVNICSREKNDNIVIVCYVGSAHAKAVRDFFCGPLEFKRKTLVGKFNWEDDEPVLLDLPTKLWNLSELFQ